LISYCLDETYTGLLQIACDFYAIFWQGDVLRLFG